MKFEYSSLAKIYEKESARCVPGYLDELLPVAVSALAVPEQGTALDLACGPGTFSEAILRQYDVGTLHCVDGTEEMLQLCRARLADHSHHVRFTLADVFAYNPAATFDSAFCGMFLHIFSVEQKKRILEMIRNHMKPGSRFVLTDVIRYADPKVQQEALKIRKEFALSRGASSELILAAYEKESSVDTPLTSEEMITLLRDTGFKNIASLYQRTTFAAFSSIAS